MKIFAFFVYVKFSDVFFTFFGFGRKESLPPCLLPHVCEGDRFARGDALQKETNALRLLAVLSHFYPAR